MARSTPAAPCSDELIPATAASARWRAASVAGSGDGAQQQHGEQQAAGNQLLGVAACSRVRCGFHNTFGSAVVSSDGSALVRLAQRPVVRAPRAPHGGRAFWRLSAPAICQADERLLACYQRSGADGRTSHQGSNDAFVGLSAERAVDWCCTNECSFSPPDDRARCSVCGVELFVAKITRARASGEVLAGIAAADRTAAARERTSTARTPPRPGSR